MTLHTTSVASGRFRQNPLTTEISESKNEKKHHTQKTKNLFLSNYVLRANALHWFVAS